MIKRTAFKHGWWYHYCLHNKKSDKLITNGFSQLQSYLLAMFDKCPHQHFENGPRSSRIKFQLPSLNIKEHANHEICNLTRLGLEINEERYKSNHMKVQMFMLEHDKKTVSIEVPVWLKTREFGSFKTHFDSEYPLTGHIDLLQVDKNNIWVWDYKPGASKEKYAATQTYFYALMLSNRTGIPLDKFRCGWFDTCNCFTFKPERKSLDEF
ncbi:MAG: PD-(D/E)XK nuclease family protein [Nanoarchaeota archaeon]|nr:PD-(D/E)XK nuclease family protein [Nanoarchaeota archaeon]MBU4352739.1 PD-(D/E)XK nuclease family protein [Nanoarchaeota archaeon]MBU4456355.1 PD-(D/E)XK nuclease family protein [Nanoarchaeota archaeon]MCG2719278.1 PD-(D/E)XK nuclease family protein [Nanoarchaeota archaeon]